MLGRMISFVMLPFYAHILRDTGYGVIGMIDAALVFLSSLMGFQFQGALIRIYHEETDAQRKKLVVPTGSLLSGVITLVLVTPAALLSRPISNLLLGSSEYWHLICIATASFTLQMVGLSAQTILVVQQRSVAFSLISVVRMVTGISLNVLFVVILRWDLTGYFIAGFCSTVLATAITCIIAFRSCGYGFDRTVARAILAFQLPLIPGSITNFVSRQIERVLVRFQIDISTLGVLEMAYKFPVLLNLLVIIPFMRTWDTKRTEIADEPGAPLRIGQMFSYFLFLAMACGLLLAVNIRTVLMILTPPEFWDAFYVARIEILRVIFMGCFLYLRFGLYYAKRTGTLARIQIVTSTIKVGLSYILISQWGLFGAAWSGLSAAVMMTISGYVLGQRHYRMSIEWRKVFFIVAAATTLFVAIDSIKTETIETWFGPMLATLQNGLIGLQDSWIGTWKNGKLLDILTTKMTLVLDLVIRTVIALGYFLIVPIVHVETQGRITRWLRFGRPRYD